MGKSTETVRDLTATIGHHVLNDLSHSVDGHAVFVLHGTGGLSAESGRQLLSLTFQSDDKPVHFYQFRWIETPKQKKNIIGNRWKFNIDKVYNYLRKY